LVATIVILLSEVTVQNKVTIYILIDACVFDLRFVRQSSCIRTSHFVCVSLRMVLLSTMKRSDRRDYTPLLQSVGLKLAPNFLA
jgi:hypothetical protein